MKPLDAWFDRIQDGVSIRCEHRIVYSRQGGMNIYNIDVNTVMLVLPARPFTKLLCRKMV